MFKMLKYDVYSIQIIAEMVQRWRIFSVIFFLNWLTSQFFESFIVFHCRVHRSSFLFSFLLKMLLEFSQIWVQESFLSDFKLTLYIMKVSCGTCIFEQNQVRCAIVNKFFQIFVEFFRWTVFFVFSNSWELNCVFLFSVSFIFMFFSFFGFF